MPDYELYDKLVAETLSAQMQEAAENNGLIIDNYLKLGYTKYFIEVGKIACGLTQTQLYVKMGLFQFYWYKLRHRKLMKNVKRYTKKATATGPSDITILAENILSKYNITYKNIFEDIYQEYSLIDEHYMMFNKFENDSLFKKIEIIILLFK